MAIWLLYMCRYLYPLRPMKWGYLRKLRFVFRKKNEGKNGTDVMIIVIFLISYFRHFKYFYIYLFKYFLNLVSTNLNLIYVFEKYQLYFRWNQSSKHAESLNTTVMILIEFYHKRHKHNNNLDCASLIEIWINKSHH